MARISKSEAKRRAAAKSATSGRSLDVELAAIMADNVVFDDAQSGCADTGSVASAPDTSSYGGDSTSC